MDTDSRKKDILIFGEGPADGLGDTTITAEAKYSVKITESRKKICLSQHYNGANSFLYANGVKIGQFNAKGSEIKSYIYCLWKML